MELSWSHVLRDKGDSAFIIITPVVTENAILVVHLVEKHGVRLRGEDQGKGCFQPVFHDKVNDLIKDRYGVSIETHHKGTHHSDFAFMKALDAFCIFSSFIRKLMHMIEIHLGKRFETDVQTQAA